jgi:hypothetical protein
MSIDGERVWIANTDDVVEISAKTGALVRVIGTGRKDFQATTGILAVGDRVWVANLAGGPASTGSITELEASNGAVLRVIR